jgi:hypothetical protein
MARLEFTLLATSFERAASRAISGRPKAAALPFEISAALSNCDQRKGLRALASGVIGGTDEIQWLAEQRLEADIGSLAGEDTQSDLDDTVLDRINDRRGIDIADMDIERCPRGADAGNGAGEQGDGNRWHARDVAATHEVHREARHRRAGTVVMRDHGPRFLEHRATDLREVRLALAIEQRRSEIVFELLQGHRYG